MDIAYLVVLLCTMRLSLLVVVQEIGGNERRKESEVAVKLLTHTHPHLFTLVNSTKLETSDSRVRSSRGIVGHSIPRRAERLTKVIKIGQF